MTEHTSIIDPPVTPYSPPGEIEAWIEELKTYKQTPEVLLAIEQANEYLKISRANHS